MDKTLFERFEEKNAEDVDFGIRPQHVSYSFEPKEGYLKCKVYSYESIGNKSVIVAEIGDQVLRMIAPNGLPVKIDEDVYVDFKLDASMFFDAETKDYVGRYDEASILALHEEEED